LLCHPALPLQDVCTPNITVRAKTQAELQAELDEAEAPKSAATLQALANQEACKVSPLHALAVYTPTSTCVATKSWTS
jgi:hypothetical protein